MLTKGSESAIIHKLSRNASRTEREERQQEYLENRIVRMNSTNESECTINAEFSKLNSSNFETTGGLSDNDRRKKLS